MTLISLKGMEFFAFHGCFSEEQIIGNKFIVDIEFDCDTSEAEYSDDLTKTINYQDVYNVVKTEMYIKSKLLEHVGRRIVAAIIKKFSGIHNIRVKISKCNPPIGGKVDKVSVIINEKFR